MEIMRDEVWTTKDGEKIQVKDMSETHVRNALRSMLRYKRKQEFLSYRNINGDMGQFLLEQAEEAYSEKEDQFRPHDYYETQDIKTHRNYEYEENDMASDYQDGGW